MGRRGLVDRDRERDHVGPERDRERAERRRENEADHEEGRPVPPPADADGQHDRGGDADRREDEQIRPLEPSSHNRKVLAERIGEHDDEEDEQPERQIGDEAISRLSNLALALPDEPAGAEQRVAETQTDAAQQREGTEPAEFAPGIAAIDHRQALDERSDHQALDERGEQRSADEARVPDPTRALRLVAEFECDSAQDQAGQHDQQREDKRPTAAWRKPAGMRPRARRRQRRARSRCRPRPAPPRSSWRAVRTRSRVRPNSMPTPRSKPSSST